MPNLFTEYGVVMKDKELNQRIEHLERGSIKLFNIVFKRLDNIKSLNPTFPKKRRKIGVKKE